MLNLRTLLPIYAVLVLIGGLVAIAVPAPYMSLYGVTAPDAAAVVLLRVVGAAGIGLAVMCWFARNAAASPARDALILGLAVTNALTGIVLVMGALSGSFNALSWMPAAMYLIFAVLFGLAARPAASPQVASASGA